MEVNAEYMELGLTDLVLISICIGWDLWYFTFVFHVPYRISLNPHTTHTKQIDSPEQNFFFSSVPSNRFWNYNWEHTINVITLKHEHWTERNSNIDWCKFIVKFISTQMERDWKWKMDFSLSHSVWVWWCVCLWNVRVELKLGVN